jgi:tetratricopeptide (TPR) repeat protein
MNRNDFLDRASNYAQVSATDIVGLKEVLGRYPYFQPARALLVRALKISDDISFQEELKDAALHAGDRRLLKQIIEGKLPEIVKEVEVTVESTEAEIFANPSLEAEPVGVALEEVFSSSETDTTSDTIEIAAEEQQEEEEPVFEVPPVVKEAEILSQILEYPEIAEVSNDQASIVSAPPHEENQLPEKLSFTEWLKRSKMEHPAEPKKEIEKEPFSVAPKEKVEEESLISKFIETDPRISPPTKAAFFSPVDMARKSVEDRDDVVSETLAKIYAAQGDIQRAIRIYNKLSLLYPEKNSYFAALIEKLENPS